MRKFFTIASLFALALSSCTKETAKGDEKGEGQVSISCVTVTEVDDTRANVSCTTPAAEDFSLRIEGVGHTYTANYATIAEFNEGDNYLNNGKFKATVTAGNIAEEGYDKATFVGSAEFTVEPRENQNVEITATIANALVKVEVTDAFKAYFPGGHSLKLTTKSGTEFDVTEQTEPLFIAPTSFKITGTGTKQANQSGAEASTIAIPEYNNDQLEAQHYYTVKLDVSNVGQATLTVTLNDTIVEEQTIETELNDNSDNA